MPTDEQMRERELFAYVTGYESRNAEVQALMEQHAQLLAALKGLVKANEDWNAAVAEIVETPPNWTDKYLDEARAAIARAEGGAE